MPDTVTRVQFPTGQELDSSLAFHGSRRTKAGTNRLDLPIPLRIGTR
mgnify:FL=1